MAGRSCAGSHLVVSYLAADDLDDVAREFHAVMGALAAESGEPLSTWWSRADAEAAMTGAGWAVVDHPSRRDLVDRYFADRSDGLEPYGGEGIIAGRLEGAPG